MFGTLANHVWYGSEPRLVRWQTMFGTLAYHVWYAGKPCLVRWQTTFGTVAYHVWYGGKPCLIRWRTMFGLVANHIWYDGIPCLVWWQTTFGTLAHHVYFTGTERQIGDYFLSIRSVPATLWPCQWAGRLGFGRLCGGQDFKCTPHRSILPARVCLEQKAKLKLSHIYKLVAMPLQNF